MSLINSFPFDSKTLVTLNWREFRSHWTDHGVILSWRIVKTRRYFSLHHELHRWHEYVEDQKKPPESETENNKFWRALRSIRRPSEEITAADPISKILELHAPKKNEEEPGFF